MKKQIVIGIAGTVLDRRGKHQNRWSKWRPTVGLCSQANFHIDRFELIHHQEGQFAGMLKTDILAASPDTQVCLTDIALKDAWDFEEVYTAFLDFAEHYPFKPDQEDYYVHITTGTHVAQICWYLLAESRHLPAKLIQTSPVRPEDKDQPGAAYGNYSIIDLDLSRYNKIAARFREQAENAIAYLKAGIVTKNKTFNQVIAEIERVAVRSSAPMLIMGPTGAGKSFLAKRIYVLKRHSHQIQGAFIEINCATLRGDSAMSTLFGHSKGAFTGAQTERAGLLRSADGGILFLDEIGELGLDEQAMLLKAIEEKRFLPFGSDKEVTSQFQLIAGTHRDLRLCVKQGTFREDLYARINLWTFNLPGLADRPEDIEPNIDYELSKYAIEYGQQMRFNSEAKKEYLDFATSPQALWSGNFRELSSSIIRMATLAEAGRITKENVSQEITRLKYHWGENTATKQLSDLLSEQLPLEKEIDLFDAYQLKSVLAICHTSKNLSEAGRTLFAVSRAQKQQPNDADRLKKYLARFGLDWEKVQAMKINDIN